MPVPCPVCKLDLNHPYWFGQPEGTYIDCKRCGPCRLKERAARELQGLSYSDDGQESEMRRLCCGALRELSERGVEPVVTTLDGLLSSVVPPADPLESIDRLILFVNRRSKTASSLVELDHTLDFPAVYASGPAELGFIVQKAMELGYLECPTGSNSPTMLTLEGWRRIRELRTTETKSNQAFVAMWFATEMDEAYSDGLYPALKDTGFDPVRVDRIEHNEKIDDQIVAGIRKSGLLVADFTGHRQGVYFEAGLAYGLGIPVIWSCRSDYMTDEDGRRPHFDTRQYNHIVWDDPAALRKRLVDRIEATIPGRAKRHGVS